MDNKKITYENLLILEKKLDTLNIDEILMLLNGNKVNELQFILNNFIKNIFENKNNKNIKKEDYKKIIDSSFHILNFSTIKSIINNCDDISLIDLIYEKITILNKINNGIDIVNISRGINNITFLEKIINFGINKRLFNGNDLKEIILKTNNDDVLSLLITFGENNNLFNTNIYRDILRFFEDNTKDLFLEKIFNKGKDLFSLYDGIQILKDSKNKNILLLTYDFVKKNENLNKKDIIEILIYIKDQNIGYKLYNDLKEYGDDLIKEDIIYLLDNIENDFLIEEIFDLSIERKFLDTEILKNIINKSNNRLLRIKAFEIGTSNGYIFSTLELESIIINGKDESIIEDAYQIWIDDHRIKYDEIQNINKLEYIVEKIDDFYYFFNILKLKNLLNFINIEEIKIKIFLLLDKNEKLSNKDKEKIFNDSKSENLKMLIKKDSEKIILENMNKFSLQDYI